MFVRFIKLLFLLVVFNTSNYGFAQEFLTDDFNKVFVEDFIKENRAPTYDCPNPDNFSLLEELLTSGKITEQQRLALSVEKSHFLLCDGEIENAHTLLFSIIESLVTDKRSDFYALALYNIGYGYDVLEKDERCDFYQQAKAISSPTVHSDVFLSASLGLITYCEGDNSAVTSRLKKLFYILQTYSKTDNYGAIAHIHNAIGLIYGRELSQYSMAAQQYSMAHKLGLPVYTGANQLSILISVINAQLTSGQFEKAYQSIAEFKRINQEVGTPLTNFYYFYSLANYYYRVEDIENMRLVLPDLIAHVKLIKNTYFQKLVDWFVAVPCVYENDVLCIREYLSKYGDTPTSTSPSYYKMLAQMHILLDEKEESIKALNNFEQATNTRYFRSQDSAGILGVANLYSQIGELKSEIDTERSIRKTLITGGLVFLIIVLGLITYLLRKKQLERMSIDPVTNLLNLETAINRIAKVELPEQGRTNALAIFDLGNFREVNVALGATSSDYVLREIAKSFQNITRTSDIVGRFSPEQLILCSHNIDEQSAMKFFNRVQKELDNTRFNQSDNTPISVRSSMSVFTTTERFSDLSTIFEEMLLSMNINRKTLKTNEF